MTLPDYETALARAVDGVTALGVETVSLARAAGAVLRSDVATDRDLPPFRRAQMDGYALRASDLVAGVAMVVVGTVAAGQAGDVAVPPGGAVKIATGAPLPPDVDTVVPHELTDRADPVRFTIDHVEPGHAVHARGADARGGDVVLVAGTTLAAHHLGIAATVGATALRVTRRPRVLVLTSGDEVRPPGDAVADHQIRNSNGIMLVDLLRRAGAGAVTTTHLADDRELTIRTVRAAVREHDLVITVGGVSAGERDFFPDAFAASDVRETVRGAAIQPGKPIAVGRAPGGATVVALPGNPVSALVCATLFVRPILDRLLGREPVVAWRAVRLAAPVVPNARRQAFRPAILERDDRARVPSWAGSGDLVHTAPTTGIVALPVQREPVPADAARPYLPWP